MKPIIFRSRIFSGEWSRGASEKVLDILLEALVQIDILWLRLNPSTPKLKDSGVRYYHEGIVDEWFTIEEAIHEGVADCKTLATWRVAELRVSGEDPGARVTKKFAVIRDPAVGEMLLYHIIVQRSDGTIEDPSRETGMHEPEPDGYIPVPGIHWPVLNRMTNIIGAGMLGNAAAVKVLIGLRERADAGDTRAKYLIEVARLLRLKGYDPTRSKWVRKADGSWDWVHEGGD